MQEEKKQYGYLWIVNINLMAVWQLKLEHIYGILHLVIVKNKWEIHSLITEM